MIHFRRIRHNLIFVWLDGQEPSLVTLTEFEPFYKFGMHLHLAFCFHTLDGTEMRMSFEDDLNTLRVEAGV